MKMDELLAFVSRENARLREYHEGLDETRAPVLQTVKLNEEVGELCDSVLAFDSFQRAEKLDAFDEADVAEELADVLITTLLLADSVDVDVERALASKIEVLEQRYE